MSNEEVGSKKCSKCKTTKEFGEFSKDKQTKDGLNARCTECRRQINKIYNQVYKIELAERRVKNRVKRAKYYKKYSETHKEENISRCKRYYQTHKDEKVEYCKQRKRTDLVFKFRKNISSRLYQEFKRIGSSKNGRSIFSILGYAKEDLANRLLPYLGKLCERCGLVEITLSNCNIDHILPISLAKTKQDIIILSNYNNLRLICKKCNLKKSNKLHFDNAKLPNFAHLYLPKDFLFSLGWIPN